MTIILILAALVHLATLGIVAYVVRTYLQRVVVEQRRTNWLLAQLNPNLIPTPIIATRRKV